MAIDSYFWNFYNVEGRYTPTTKEPPSWKERYEVVEDEIKRENNDPDCDVFRALTKLEETYYSLGVSNRAKYKTVQEVENALTEKYNSPFYRNRYSQKEIWAMYDNEKTMTLFGCITGGQANLNDPHITIDFSKAPSDSEEKAYNRQMIGRQISGILSKGGISSSILEKYDMTFSVEPFYHKIKVSGVEDKELATRIEELLNKGNNAKELFFYTFYETSRSIDKDIITKYAAIDTFLYITGEDLRNYKQTEGGMVNEKGENALEVFRRALKTSEKAPILYRDVWGGLFEERLETVCKKDFFSIPDLNLSIGYKNGSLYNVKNEDVQRQWFNVTA